MSRNQGNNNKNNNSPPEYIRACSVDNFARDKPHQAISVKHYDDGLVQLDYSIYVPQPDMDVFDLLGNKFYSLAISDKKNKQQEAQEVYREYSNQITQGHFSGNSFQEARTFGILIDPKQNFAVLEMSARNTMVLIDEAHTYAQVNKKQFESPYKQELIFCNKFAAANKKPPQNKLLKFQEVNQSITLLVQDFASKHSYDNKIEMIHRAKDPRNTPLHSVNYINTSSIKDSQKAGKDLTARITCSSYAIEAGNIMAQTYHEQFSGDNLYSPEEGYALAIMANQVKQRTPRKMNYVIYK